MDEQRALELELLRLREIRDAAPTLRKQAEWCVAIEEEMGGRPPTRSYGIDLSDGRR